MYSPPQVDRLFLFMTYQDKLKLPAWQRKRLEIFQRDNFKCTRIACGNTEMQLHVHHKAYEYGKEPWDYPDEYLITLCESCHKEATECIKNLQSVIIKNIKLKINEPFIMDCFAEIVNKSTGLEDIIYLLWQMKIWEEESFEVLRKTCFPNPIILK